MATIEEMADNYNNNDKFPEKPEELNHLTNEDKQISPKHDRSGPYKKVFVQRNSILTDMYESVHIKTIYNLFIVITIYLVLINVLYEWRENQSINFGLNDFAQKFNRIEIGFLIWLINMWLTFLIFPMFRIWAKISKHTHMKKSLGTVFIVMYTIYLIITHGVTIVGCEHFELAVVTRFAVLLETIRLSMKSYAFIRSNAEQVLAEEDFISPTAGQFMYFLFCPTLLYRDSYPRTKTRDWRKVLKHLFEFLITVYSMALVNNNFLQKWLEDYGKRETTIVIIFVQCIEITLVVSLLFYFYSFYVLQHAWMNMFAELLQFGDRAFYKDWWSSRSMREFYRRWSLIVHDWLYEYVYTDVYKHVTRKSVTISSLFTIVLSAVVHEYVLVICLRFFVPSLLALYLTLGIAFMYVNLKNPYANIFVLFNLIIGMSMLILVYSMEYYGRINCSAGRNTTDTLAYYYTPMIIKCNNIIFY